MYCKTNVILDKRIPFRPLSPLALADQPFRAQRHAASRRALPHCMLRSATLHTTHLHTSRHTLCAASATRQTMSTPYRDAAQIHSANQS